MAVRAAAEPTSKWALAPGATTMLFSPTTSTMTTAEPLGPGMRATASALTPLLRRCPHSNSAAGSSPTAATRATEAPARAAATAWLPPLPPGADVSDEASTV